MNLKNLLDYSNIIYNFNGKINSVERKNRLNSNYSDFTK